MPPKKKEGPEESEHTGLAKCPPVYSLDLIPLVLGTHSFVTALFIKPGTATPKSHCLQVISISLGNSCVIYGFH